MFEALVIFERAGLVSPREDVFAGVWIGRCAKLGDHHPVLRHGANVGIRLDKPETHYATKTELADTAVPSNVCICKCMECVSQMLKHPHTRPDQGQNELFLLPVVCHLAVLQVKLVNESLSVKQVVERFISHLEETRTHPEKTAPEP